MIWVLLENENERLAFFGAIHVYPFHPTVLANGRVCVVSKYPRGQKKAQGVVVQCCRELWTRSVCECFNEKIFQIFGCYSLVLQIPCEARCLGTLLTSFNPLQNHLQKGPLEHKGLLVTLSSKGGDSCRGSSQGYQASQIYDGPMVSTFEAARTVAP